MRRNRALGLKLLELIQQHDEDGVGLERDELHTLIGQSVGISDKGALTNWDVIDYHLELLEGAGFVKLQRREREHDHSAQDDYFSLTWSGHDQIEAD